MPKKKANKSGGGSADVLKSLAKSYDTAVKNMGRGGGGLGVGSYQVQVTGHEMKKISKGKSIGQLGSLFRFVVSNGPKKGKKHTKFQNLQGVNEDGEPIGLSIFLDDLKTMGVEVKKSDLKKLDKKAEEAIGRTIEIEVVQNGRYKNTYINDLVEAEEEEEEDEEIEEDEDEEEEEEEDDDDTDLELEEDEEEEEEEEEPPKKKRGRPKGSKNKKKKDDVDALFD